MSTRCLIGIHYEDHMHGIYCHYDGNPGHVGKILVEHHNSFGACQKIMDGAQIRNFDHDGQYARFSDGPNEGVETYTDVEEALSSGFDYVYLFDAADSHWRCYGKDRGVPATIKEFDIPNNHTV